MDQYFLRMRDLSTNKELPSRIRFMLMDVIELRQSNVSRVHGGMKEVGGGGMDRGNEGVGA